MKVLLLKDVIVPPHRQRKEFEEGALQELVTSIQEKGLLQAPVCRGNQLVAGERRLRAISEIAEFGGLFKYDGKWYGPGEVPVTDLGELDPLTAKELELEENLRRVNLTWQEQVAAEAELAALRTEQARIAGKPAPTNAELAEEFKGKVMANPTRTVTESLVLAKNLHRPEVANAKTQREALKGLKRVEEQERNAEMAAKLGKEHLSAKHRLVQGDCVEWMKGQEPAQFDVILSDPPYGMGADEFGDSGGATGGSDGAHFYEDSAEVWENLIAASIPEISRLAKADAHLYLFCDFDHFRHLKTWCVAHGWKVFRTPLIWFKPSAFRAPWPEKGPQRKYECILYAVRGELKCTSLAGDVIQCPPDENLGHPAQKPVALFTELLRRSARPGMKVLDPFCGSGPIFEAAQGLSVYATGVEKDAAAAGIAAGRLQRLGAGK